MYSVFAMNGVIAFGVVVLTATATALLIVKRTSVNGTNDSISEMSNGAGRQLSNEHRKLKTSWSLHF